MTSLEMNAMKSQLRPLYDETRFTSRTWKSDQLTLDNPSTIRPYFSVNLFHFKLNFTRYSD
jgi:hypothetical protein